MFFSIFVVLGLLGFMYKILRLCVEGIFVKYRIGANWAPVLIRPPPHENPNRTPVKKRYWNNWTPSWIDPHPRYQYICDFTRNGKNLTIFRRNHDVLFIQKLDKLKLLSHKEHWCSFSLMNSLYMFFHAKPTWKCSRTKSTCKYD